MRAAPFVAAVVWAISPPVSSSAQVGPSVQGVVHDAAGAPLSLASVYPFMSERRSLMMVAVQGPTDSATVGAVADSVALELLDGPLPVPGFAVAVSRAGEVVFERAYGLVDVRAGRALELDDALQIGSITKQFTAAAVLRLVERGAISLDDSLQTYLPDFDTQGHHVTIRHLLNHTSGIPSYTSIFGDPVSRSVLLDSIQTHPFDFGPGQEYRYNNSGYYLLGLVLEVVTGEPYGRHLESVFFGPLGLRSTAYCGFAGEPTPTGYQTGPDGLEPAALDDMSFAGAAGGLCSTVTDLLAWQWALATGRVVSPERYRSMTTPTVLTSGERIPYGFGLALSPQLEQPAVFHGGGITGFNAHLAFYSGAELGVAVIVNTSTGWSARIADAVARAALGMDQVARTDIPLTEQQRAVYAGVYDLRDGRTFRVFEQQETLMAQPSGSRALPLLYQGSDTFRPELIAGITIEFDVREGRATGLVLTQGDDVIEALRVD